MLWTQSSTKNYTRDENKLQSPNYSFHKSLHHTSFFLRPQSNSIHSFKTQTQKNTCFWAYLYSAGTQHGNLHPAGWPILFCGPTQEQVLDTANIRKAREWFWINAGEWTARIEISKEKIPAVIVACMALYWPTPGFKGRTFQLCVLTRWDFDFYVRSSPLRGNLPGPTAFQKWSFQSPKLYPLQSNKIPFTCGWGD